MKNLELIQGDARKLPLGDETVQCVVTSPPYWGLRKYSGEQESIWGGFPKIDHGSLKAIPCRHEFSGEDVSDIREETASGKSRTTERFYGDKSRKFNGNHQKHFQTHTCVHCGAWRGAFGLEPMIEMYVAHTVEILRECWRVLRSDGVLFWNIGDSYVANRSYQVPDSKWKEMNAREPEEFCKSKRIARGSGRYGGGNNSDRSLKPKDLCLIPSRVAIAAQADGWWVRSMIVWAKPNPMPESVTDRPTDAYEHILMLTKSEQYFWDADAVREPATVLRPEGPNAYRGQVEMRPRGPHDAFGYTPKGTHSRGTGDGGPKARQRGSYKGWVDGTREVLASRNLRNVWMFATQPYSGAHFATFPEEIPRRCILAATSACGACAQCGAPWERVTERHVHFEGGSGKAAEKRIPSGWHQSGSGRWRPEHQERFAHDGGKHSEENAAYESQTESGDYDIRMGPVIDSQTIGWRPTCLCRGQRGKTVPCTVLDPFAGSGTTGRVALELGRRAVLVDIAYGAEDEYRKLAERRAREVQTVFPL